MSNRTINYTNCKFGLLDVKGFDEDKQKWECICECGNIIYYTSRQLQSNKPKSCGCLRSSSLVGKTFDRLFVKEKTDKRDNNYNIYYLCECNCREENKNVKLVTSTDLAKGNVRSCGCLANEFNIKLGKHLASNTKDCCIEGTNIRNLNRKLSKRNTSGYKGVTWDKSKSKWLAQISFKGKHYNLGRYNDKTEAIKVRKLAEDKLFGEFLEWYDKEYKK
jgi:hypothetical protein